MDTLTMRQAVHLPALLRAAQRTCTIADVAAALGVTVDRARCLLKYWESAGFLAYAVEPDLTARGRKRYRLTLSGRRALLERDDVGNADTPRDAASDLCAALRGRMDTVNT